MLWGKMDIPPAKEIKANTNCFVASTACYFWVYLWVISDNILDESPHYLGLRATILEGNSIEKRIDYLDLKLIEGETSENELRFVYGEF